MLAVVCADHEAQIAYAVSGWNSAECLRQLRAKHSCERAQIRHKRRARER